DGVVIGADTRATSGEIVSEKNCLKIHRIANNIYCLGAGTAADCDFQTKFMESQMSLLALESNRQIRVATVVRRLRQHLFNYMGYIGAYLIVGGVDITGPQVTMIHAHGSTATLPYITTGSGGLAALGVCEAGFKPDLSESEAMELVKSAVETAIINDMFSGSNVDLCVIKKTGATFYRPYAVIAKPEPRLKDYTFTKGVTPVIRSQTRAVKQPFDLVSENVIQIAEEEMDLS
ncbi:hypothetical protein GJ496_007449, partial [Pomphorhynchus laevis]